MKTITSLLTLLLLSLGLSVFTPSYGQAQDSDPLDFMSENFVADLQCLDVRYAADWKNAGNCVKSAYTIAVCTRWDAVAQNIASIPTALAAASMKDMLVDDCLQDGQTERMVHHQAKSESAWWKMALMGAGQLYMVVQWADEIKNDWQRVYNVVRGNLNGMDVVEQQEYTYYQVADASDTYANRSELHHRLATSVDIPQPSKLDFMEMTIKKALEKARRVHEHALQGSRSTADALRARLGICVEETGGEGTRRCGAQEQATLPAAPESELDGADTESEVLDAPGEAFAMPTVDTITRAEPAETPPSATAQRYAMNMVGPQFVASSVPMRSAGSRPAPKTPTKGVVCNLDEPVLPTAVENYQSQVTSTGSQMASDAVVSEAIQSKEELAALQALNEEEEKRNKEIIKKRLDQKW